MCGLTNGMAGERHGRRMLCVNPSLDRAATGTGAFFLYLLFFCFVLLRGDRPVKYYTLSLSTTVAVQETTLFTYKATYMTFASFISRQPQRDNDGKFGALVTTSYVLQYGLQEEEKFSICFL
jgi:hypothetical protein